MNGPERRLLARLIDSATRDRLERRQCCANCERWLIPDEYGRGRTWCRRCECLRVSRQQKAAA